MTEDELRGVALSVADDIVSCHVDRFRQTLKLRPDQGADYVICDDRGQLRRDICEAIDRFVNASACETAPASPGEYLKSVCDGAVNIRQAVRVNASGEDLARLQKRWPEIAFVGDESLDIADVALSEALRRIERDTDYMQARINDLREQSALNAQKAKEEDAVLQDSNARGRALIDILIRRQSGVRP